MADIVPTKKEKCQGAMLAAAIGDALGWPNERTQDKTQSSNNADEMFVSWTRVNRYPYWYQERILPGEYSDDTQLILAVARSILTKNWNHHFFVYELPYWLLYERGGGKALKNAARACKNNIVLWRQKNSQEYFNAGGNGVAMRILPHVIGNENSKDISKLMTEVIQDGIITHGHPRALVGALCYAYALYYLLYKEDILQFGELVSAVVDAKDIWGVLPNNAELVEWRETALSQNGYDYMSVWKQTVNQLLEKLQFIEQTLEKGIIVDDKKVLTELKCFSNIKGAGDISVLAAIYLASKYANNPVLGIKVPAFFQGIDTDTVASMTGALLGMICGTGWIPSEWTMVQDYSCLVKITELLMTDSRLASTKAYTKQIINNDLNWIQTPMGMAYGSESYAIKCKRGEVIINKLKTAFGQTIYLKRYHELENDINKENNETYSNIKTRNQENVSQLRFNVNYSDVSELLKCKKLTKKTVSKMLQVIGALMLGEIPESIAQKYNVDIDVVITIKQYIF